MIDWPYILQPTKLILLLSFPFFGYSQEIKFNRITPDEGLYSGNVRTFLQDYLGFMWIGTDDGLYRYDGYEMIAFRNIKGNPASLGDNLVLTVFEDSNQNLWIGTFNGGLSLYNRKFNNFYNFLHEANDPHSLGGNSVRVIYEDGDKNLFVGSNKLSYFNLGDFPSPDSIRFNNYDLVRVKNKSNENWVSALYKSNDNKLWVGTRFSGVLSFDVQAPANGLVGSPFLEVAIQSILTDSKGNTWIGTWEKGVRVYDKPLKQKAEFKASGAKNTINHNLITQIKEDNLGNIWIATDEGLSKFHAHQDPFSSTDVTSYRHDATDQHSLLSNPIKALYFDHQHRMWVGSFSGGISMYDPYLPRFNSYQPNVFKPDGLSNGNVWAFCRDKNERLWIGTDGGGLYVIEPDGKGKYEFTAFEKVVLLNPATKEKEEKIKCLTLDSTGHVWIGTWAGGVFRLNPETEKYRHFGMATDERNGLITSDIISIKAEGNNIWIGNFNGGLTYYNPLTEKFSTFTQYVKGNPERINYILPTSTSGNVLTAQELGGLNYYSSKRGYLSTINSDIITPKLSINTLHRDGAGNLWFGAINYGLIKYNEKTNAIRIYGQTYGLTNYHINAIQEDENKNLWLSTNQGLFKFDVIEEQFTSYTKIDGLQGNQYNLNSAVTLADGMMLFGGTNGFDFFYPKEIKINQKNPDVILTRFWLNDQVIDVTDSLSPLKEDITVNSKIELQHTQNSFSIEFAAIDFTHTQHISYQFIMEGLNERWQQLGHTRKVTFTDLKPGTYKLKIKASNKAAQWPEKFKLLTIEIYPAWWQTYWFKTAAVAALVLAAFGVHRVRLNFLITQKKSLEAIVEHRTKELAFINNEVQAQNEELVSQNEQINSQRLNLEEARNELKSLNDNLEALVEERTLKLERTISKLDKTLRELDRFIYSASHELGAPLKSIQGLLNLARLESDPDIIKKCHHYIGLSITKLEGVIKNLSDFSRNTHLKLANETFSLNVFVNGIVDELKFWPEAENVNIVNMVPKEFTIYTDPHRLRMILFNLISNSIKYADAKKPLSFVHINSSNSNNHYTIEVTDNGIGIDPRNQDKVFDMFYRASEQSAGSGLGLYIVKETLNALKGTIDVNSIKSEGTTFIVYLNNLEK